MAIEFVGADGFNGNMATITCDRPAGTQSGDVLIGMVLGFAPSVGTPSGWSRYLDLERLTVFYRVVSDIGSEPSSYTFPNGTTYGGSAVIVAAFRGVDNSSPFAVSTPSSVTGSGSSTVVPSVDVAVNEAMLLAPAAVPSTTIYPTGVAGMQASVGNWKANLFYQGLSASGASGPRTITWSGSGGGGRYAILTALRPAGGDPPGPTARPWSRGYIVE